MSVKTEMKQGDAIHDKKLAEAKKQQALIQIKLKERTIGRWRIGSTLGKGGYSWVKKGHDKKTNKCVALKFMRKADKTWEKEQTKQVVTEIECLKQIKHENVLKLYAYNLNAKYPTTQPVKNINTGEISFKKIDTILLVLEYAPGGEIFDILYYTHALESVLARTYFRQAIFGIEACHNAGIAHRDIKAQNLLLDSRFNLKICDFGLSKVFESDKDSIMKTSYVGTRGYQAPELILQKPYNSSCDIFSLAVVIFILINGYPPFEQAAENDRWFNPLVTGDTKKFWKMHKQCKIRKDTKCQDLLGRMLAFDPKKRITINEIKKHPWFNGKYLEGKNLIKVLRQRHREMEKKRREDGRKLADLQTSIKRAINFGKVKSCEQYPVDQIEGCNDNEQYSYAKWMDILNLFSSYIGNNSGKCTFDPDANLLDCEIKLKAGKTKEEELKFTVKVFESNEYSIKNMKKYYKGKREEAKETDNADGYNNDDAEEATEMNKKIETEIIYVIRLTKLEGNTEKWVKLKSDMLTKCQNAVTGLPDWAKKIDISANMVDDKKKDKEVDDKKEEENEDDYEKELKKEKNLWN